MDDIAKIIADLHKITTIQGDIIQRLTYKLLEYIELDEIEGMYEGKEEVQRLSEKWQP